MRFNNLFLAVVIFLYTVVPLPTSAAVILDEKAGTTIADESASQPQGLELDVQCSAGNIGNNTSKVFFPMLRKAIRRQFGFLWFMEDETAAGIGESAGASDQTVPLGSTLNYKVTTGLTGVVTFTVSPLPLMLNASFDAATGKFVFTPAVDQIGKYVLIFTASNGTKSETTTLNINVPQPDPKADTVLCGRILDANEAAKGVEKPLFGATVMHLQSRRTVKTDANGFFKFTGLPSGLQQFDYDGRSAYPQGFYGTYRSDKELLPNVINEITRPVYLMKLDSDSVVSVKPNATTIVSNPKISATLNIPANTVKDGVGGYYAGFISLSQVPQGYTPASLPSTQNPALVMTLQPMGLTFAQPVPISFANIDQLAPGTEVELWSMDHATAEFFVAGKGKVSADGKMINTISGGVRESSWHYASPPQPSSSKPDDNSGNNNENEPKQCMASSVNLRDGCVETAIQLPPYITQGQSRSVNLVYNSSRANPIPFVPFEATIPAQSARPKQLSYSVVSSGGVRNNSNPIYIDTSKLASGSQPIRAVADFDFTSQPTGVYPYNIRLTNHFARSSVSADVKGDVVVVNERNSAYGAGWGVAGLQQLHVQKDKSLLIVDGASQATRFRSNIVKFDDFSDISQLQLNGGAKDTDVNGRSVLKLASADATRGSSFLRDPISLVAGNNLANFSTHFSFQINSTKGTGDGEMGVAFILATNPFALGNSTGGAPGYEGITPSVAVEFDAYKNGNSLKEDHVGINLNGDGDSTVEITSTIPFKTAKPLFAWIDYDGNTKILEVRVTTVNIRPSSPVLTYTIELTKQLKQNLVYAGFTSSTSTSRPADNIILNWHLNVSSSQGNNGEERFVAPVGEFSDVTRKSDGTYIRRIKDGTEYHFNAAGLQTAIIDRNGNATVYAYDSNKRLLTITDPVGKETTLTYQNGKLQKITDPVGRVTNFTVDNVGNLTQVTFPDGAQRKFGYDSRHLMVSENDERDQQTTRVFDKWGRLTEAKLPTGVTRYAATSQSIGLVDPSTGIGTQSNPAPMIRPGDAKAVLTDGEGRKRSFTLGKGNSIGTSTNAAGFITQYTRDQDGNATQVKSPAGAIYNNTYDGRGNLLTYNNQTLNGKTSFTYDAAYNNVTSITDPNNKNTFFVYDVKGNLNQVKTPLNRTSVMSYTTFGAVSASSNSIGTQVVLNYDTQRNPTQVAVGSGADQRNMTIGYSPAGYVTNATDPIGRVVTYEYDSMGRLISENLTGGRKVTYQYDAKGKLISLTPPGKPAHRFEYDDYGLVKAYIPPAVAGSGSTSTIYEYNKAQQPTRVLRPDGKVIVFNYDSAGRLKNSVEPRGETSYVYNNANGKLSKITSPDNITLDYGYDDDLLTTLKWSGPISGNVAFTYDRFGRYKSDSVNGNVVNYAYDDDGALTSRGNLSLDYDDKTGLLNTTRISNISDSRTYNALGEPTRYTAKVSNTTLLDIAHNYDKLGRITSKTEAISGTNITYAYGYDEAGRLAEVRQNGNLVESYTYDANGNRLTGTGGATGTYDAQDRLLSYGNNTYTYSANGELQSANRGGQNTSYSYDTSGNLISVTLPNSTQINYLIDGQDRRVGKKVNGVLTQGFLYESQLRPVAELDGMGAVVARFVYGTKVNVPEYMVKGNATYRILTDHLGSVRLVVNASTGVIVQRMDYDAWGKIISDTQPGFQPFGFAGGLYEPLTGLVRFGARDYDVEIGRWLSKDSIGFDSGDTNFYSYTINNPINYSDPMGAEPYNIWSGDPTVRYLQSLAEPRPPRPYVDPNSPKHVDRNVYNNCYRLEPKSGCPGFPKKEGWLGNRFHDPRTCYRGAAGTKFQGSQCCYYEDGTLDDSSDKMGSYDYGRTWTLKHLDDDYRPHKANPNYTPNRTTVHENCPKC